MAQYALHPGSRLICFEDASGIGIYSGYSGDTFFLNSTLNGTQPSTRIDFDLSLNVEVFQNILGISESESQYVVDTLVEKRVLWKIHQ